MTPLVSVIIPFRDRMSLTESAIRSIFGQSYPNVETIVINDASTECDSRLKQLLLEGRNARYIPLEQNVGPGGARNSGIQASMGEYIAFLDSDDTWVREKLEIQIADMLRENWSFSHTSYFRHRAEDERVQIVRSGRHTYRFPLPAFHCGIATPTVVLKRSLLSGLSFRSDLRFAEDGLLWLALSKRTALCGIDKPLSHVYTGNLTTARDTWKQAEALKLMARHGLSDHPW